MKKGDTLIAFAIFYALYFSCIFPYNDEIKLKIISDQEKYMNKISDKIKLFNKFNFDTIK